MADHKTVSVSIPKFAVHADGALRDGIVSIFAPQITAESICKLKVNGVEYPTVRVFKARDWHTTKNPLWQFRIDA